MSKKNKFLKVMNDKICIDKRKLKMQPLGIRNLVMQKIAELRSQGFVITGGR